MLCLGYNTNGFAHHRLEDAIEIIAEIGYSSVAVTIERDLLDPPDRRGVDGADRRLAAMLDGRGLRHTIETGARFILDPRRKHQPTMVSADPAARKLRIEFIKAAIDLAATTSADSVSLWSGTADDHADEATCMDRLCASLAELLDHAVQADVRLGFEPEPGMFIDTMGRFEHLHTTLDHSNFGLTLDVGHVVCLGDGRVEDHIRRWSRCLWNVHMEDMRPGDHEHLMFGEGQVDFPVTFAALAEIGYGGPVHVELSRHSFDAVNASRQSFEFLRRFS